MAGLLTFPISSPSVENGSTRTVWLVVVPGWLPFNLTSQDYVDKLADQARIALNKARYSISVGTERHLLDISKLKLDTCFSVFPKAAGRRHNPGTRRRILPRVSFRTNQSSPSYFVLRT